MKEREEKIEQKQIEEIPQEQLTDAAGGFPFVPVVPVAPIDAELREDV